MSRTIYVLGCGDLFFQLFNTIAAFMKNDNFMGLVTVSASFGFFVAIARYFKTRDPNTIVKWFIMYMLVFHIAVIPKTDVVIADVSNQKNYPVANVPLFFAFISEGLTSLGFGLAQIFDELFAQPDSIQYSKTGFLFGSRLIQESRDFRVTDPVLKTDLSQYFKLCVVGNIYLNHVLSPTELKESSNIWSAIAANPSKIRRTTIADDKGIPTDKSCFDATPILKKRLDAEIKRAYTIFGINIFGKPIKTNYETLFSTHLQSAFNYYQGMQTTGTNVFLQAMMLNVIKEGVTDYQSYTQSSASIMGHEFSKSQAQQRYLWEIGGLKSAWLWPFFHAVVMYLFLAMFPLIVIFIIAYNGIEAFKNYLIFFLSLQLWPVLFAVLNYAMAKYGSQVSENYGAINLANLDSVEQLHSEVASVAGYMMVFIPWLAKGVVTRIGDSFDSLSHSMISGLQSSTMAASSEAANASFSLGQTSFYNATGNTLSGNKHDTNFTSMSGNTTRMLESGALVTKNVDGTDVIDATGTMSRGSTGINASNAISGMLSDSAELNTQAIASKSKQLSRLVSEGAGFLTQFSDLKGKDARLGDGVSISDTSQVQNAVSRVLGIASNVAERTGVTTEQALTGLFSVGASAQAGFNSDKSLLGKLGGLMWGADGSLYAKTNAEQADSTAHRDNDGYEKVLDAKDAQDFRKDLSYLQNFSTNNHLDTSYSKGASLLSQASGDLREAKNLSDSLDVNYAKASRIAHAKSITETGGAAINQNLDQMFQEYVTDKVGASTRNYLYGHPGDAHAQAKLSQLANDFVADEGIRNKLIDTYGNTRHTINPESVFNKDEQKMQSEEAELYARFNKTKEDLMQQGHERGVGFSDTSGQYLKNKVHNTMESQKVATNNTRDELHNKTRIQTNEVTENIIKGRKESHLKKFIKKGE